MLCELCQSEEAHNFHHFIPRTLHSNKWFKKRFTREAHVLEVWPVGFEEPEEPGGNGRWRHEGEICYEFAEFEFGEMAKSVSLEHFHFSQQRQLFEIGWKEDGQDLELRVHIVPIEVECE